jgi:hypothetical protein
MGDQEEFLAMLNQSRVTLNCANCGGDRWSVVRSDLAIHHAEGDLKPAFLIRCDGCGHERIFSPTDPGGEPGD